jgi:hypothetical protein
VTQAWAARAQLDIDEVQAFVNRFMVGGLLAAQPRPLAAREGALCARSGSRLTRQRLRAQAREEVDAQFTGLHPERDVVGPPLPRGASAAPRPSARPRLTSRCLLLRAQSGKGGSLGLAYVFMFDFDKDKVRPQPPPNLRRRCAGSLPRCAHAGGPTEISASRLQNHKVSLPEWSAGFKGVAEQRGPDSIVA